ncbi:ABC transporter ATP-binding protein [Nonomuraea fastidiosa]|uniref:ABC transporter ATP-binding protein n=1 Tax=Nonomuraea TaxID=83681 RepID=UPI00342889C3
MTDTVISVKELRKSYGQVTAVDGLDLEIPRGQMVAILGPNGAGKSTLLNMVLGLLSPDSGTLEVLGGPPKQAVAQGRVGAMLQEADLVEEVTVGELISAVVALYPQGREVGKLLSDTGLTSLRGRRLGKLSGGQKQRVRFALAIAGSPDLYVLDEPTVGLDVESRRDFWREVASLAEMGGTVLFATHYLAEAEAYADRIVLLANGRVVADGSVATIRSMVPFRLVECTLTDPDDGKLSGLPGVTSAELRGERVTLRTTDSDATLFALMAAYPDAHDIDVGGVDLEDAFVTLTHEEN